MAIHRDLTGAELHEPKGVDTAVNNKVYMTNGAGTGAFKSSMGDNVVLVNALTDLPTASGGKIALVANTSYVFGASVNIGANFLQFSAGTSIQSHAAFTSTVTYTGTSPMLQGADANTRIKDLNLLCANSDVFSWADGTGGTSIIIVTDVLVIACKALGTFNDVGTLVIDGMTVVSCTSGIIYLGSNINGTRLSSLNLISTSTTFIGLNFTTATLGNVNIDGIVMSGGAGSIGIKGDAANANILTGRIANVENIQFQGVTTSLSGITVDDFRWNFQQNGDLADTMPDALSSFKGNVTATTITSSSSDGSNAVLVAGTWTVNRSSHFTSTTAGRITYDGERDLTTPIDIIATVNPASDSDVALYLALNGTAIDVTGQGQKVFAIDAENMSTLWQLTLTTGDFLEVFVENQSGTANITVENIIFRVR